MNSYTEALHYIKEQNIRMQLLIVFKQRNCSDIPRQRERER